MLSSTPRTIASNGLGSGVEGLMAQIPLDPFFFECLKRAAANRELVEQFDRLRGTNLSLKGSPIERMIDSATGKLDDDLGKFVDFVREYIYERLDRSSF